MVLEEAVILETYAADAAKHSAWHEMLGIGTKLWLRLALCKAKGFWSYSYSVNDIMVVPDVDLGNRSVCRRERLSTKPADVILEVVFIAFYSKLFSEWIVASLFRISDVCPLPQWAIA